MWALMPLKKFDDAKQRLSEVLSQMERRGLFQAMVQDVIDVLHKHPDIDGLLLVSEDPTAQLLADYYKLDYLNESSLKVTGLNSAVKAGVEHLSKQGIDDVMIIHGDLPLLRSKDITQLVSSHREQGERALTIAPDSHNEGTNCLLCRPASTLNFCYGAHSLARHFIQAAENDLSVRIERLWGVSWDMDTPSDLDFFMENANTKGGSRTLSFLETSGIGERMEKLLLEKKPVKNVVEFPGSDSESSNEYTNNNS